MPSKPERVSHLPCWDSAGDLVLQGINFNGIDEADILVIAGSVDAFRYRPNPKQLFACGFEELAAEVMLQTWAL
jgi:hypothetical protein